MMFTGEVIDFLFKSEDVDADTFVRELTKHFGMPELDWILEGWRYKSPHGYEVTIMTDKSLILERYNSEMQLPSAPAPKIKFE